MSSFDLAVRGFCPVRWRTGRGPSGVDTGALGFRDLLVSAHDIADVQVADPSVLAGLLRVLYVLAARVSGLDRVRDPDEFYDCRNELLETGYFDPKRIEPYFTAHEGRFELFHTASERPFLQDRRLMEQCRSSKGVPSSSGVNKLVSGRAAGQSMVWLSHTTDADMPAVTPENAVWALLSWLYFGAPGRCTPRQVGETNEANTKAGPLRGTVSFHPVGESLFETLVMGMPFEVPQGDHSVAPWESDEEDDPLGVPPEPKGLVDLLTGRFQHAVLLQPSDDGTSVTDAWITWSRRQPQGNALDPFVIYRVNKDGEPYAATADANRQAWRDLDALIGARNEHTIRPAVFTGLEDLMDEHRRPVRVKALGFDQDRAQVKDRQHIAGATPALREHWKAKHSQAPEAWYRLQQAVERAELTGSNLESALTNVWHALAKTKPNHKVRDHGSRLRHQGMTAYWDTAEAQFWDIVLADTPPSDATANRFIRCALTAYDEVTAPFTRVGSGEGGNQIKIVENARRRLWQGWQSTREGDPDE